jgi:hypothetical protein
MSALTYNRNVTLATPCTMAPPRTHPREVRIAMDLACPQGSQTFYTCALLAFLFSLRTVQ